MFKDKKNKLQVFCCCLLYIPMAIISVGALFVAGYSLAFFGKKFLYVSFRILESVIKDFLNYFLQLF